MKLNKWIAGLLLLALLCPLFGLPAKAEVDGLTVETGVKTSAGKSANVITLVGGGVFSARLILAGDKYCNSEPVEDMLKEAEKYGEVVAAFNGTWFSAYDESQATGAYVSQMDSYFEGEFGAFPGYAFQYLTDGSWYVGGYGPTSYETAGVYVSCGPELIHNSSNLIGSDYWDQNVAQRTFVGVTEAGELVVGEAATTYNDAAETLLSRGCVRALCMDGGASSFLYADGKVLQQAGRKLNNIVVIYRKDGAPAPSAWAAEEIQAAVEAGIVPQSYSNGFIPLDGGSQRYQTPIPRKEAARMFYNLIKHICGEELYHFVSYNCPDVHIGFSDTTDYSCRYAKALGIIQGMGDGTFRPNGSLTRAQAAVLACNIADLFGINRSGTAHDFTDVSGHWCDPYLGWPVREGILNGVGGGRFDPNGVLTREQAVVIAYRLLNVLLSHDASMETLKQHFGVEYYGACGVNLTWTLDFDGVLTIKGMGEMEMFMFSDRCGENSIKSVNISDSVTSIGKYAFYHCYSLQSISIPNSVTSIDEWAFRDSGITSVTIPPSVVSIGEGAFFFCGGLVSVSIPDSVTFIGEEVFAYCTELADITLPKSLTGIGNSAFICCHALRSIEMPASVTSIGSAALQYCSSLEAINVDSDNPSYCSIDGVLFDKGLTTLLQCPAGKTGACTIPASVTSIDEGAFGTISGKSAISDIYYEGTEAMWSAIALTERDSSSLADVTIHYNSPMP